MKTKFLILILTLGVLPMLATAQLTYTTNGTALTISGTGAIPVGEFYSDQSITSVTMGNGVTSIGEEAFLDCASLTNVTMSNSVINIGSAAFENCSSLMSVTMGNGVTTIGEQAFLDTSLTSVTIPNSVTNIGDYAFYYCTSLTNLTFLGNAPTMGGTNVFSYIASGATVYYYPHTTGWTNNTTYGGLPTVMLPPPPLGIGTYVSMPAVYFSFSGTYVLQMTTNLSSTNWVTVTNGVVPISGYVFTNPPPNAFFRLN